MHTPDYSGRPDYLSEAPALARKFTEFSLAVGGVAEIEPGIAHLVDLRASQLNGCVFCIDMHVKEAHLHGERELRLHHVAAWRESPLFTPRERAALAWTEALTVLAQGGVSDALWAEMHQHFDDRSLAALSFRVVAINGWNRLNIAYRTAPGARDAAYGLDRAGLS